MFDGKAFGEEIVRVVRGFVVRQLEPVLARLKALEDREPIIGKDGRDGVDGKDAAPGRDGRDGAPGRDGVDGVHGKDGRDGVDGKDGEPGSRGERGFGIDDFTLALKPDGRTVEFKFIRGEVADVFEMAFPVMIYRGVFKDGQTYDRGDTVTWAGSLWHCDGETAEKPGEISKAWTLAAKRGRDGKDGKDGDRGERGLEGPAGRDLTQLGPGGEKW